ncbi:hypothetical protein [Pseudomonas phage PPAT]|uniref:Uncharacterized protein n=1 Tax=Pseudomonas phage PPAT TaxID=2871158 RepID=A0A8K1JZH3_9VIRU|nr:hypothetical protein [Pseudomonas phage PPAT]
MHRCRERDERRRGTHIVDTLRRNFSNAGTRGAYQIDDQRVDDATNRFVDQAPAADVRERRLGFAPMDGPQRHVF